MKNNHLADLEIKQFFEIQRAIFCYVNSRLKIFRGIATPEAMSGRKIQDLVELRNATSENLDLIDDFIASNPYNLDDECLAIARSWKKMIYKDFVVFKHLQGHTLFLDWREGGKAYGVKGISDPLIDMLGTRVPLFVKTAMLPFRDKIICDGLIQMYPISIGPGMRRSIKEFYDETKAEFGILTTLNDIEADRDIHVKLNEESPPRNKTSRKSIQKPSSPIETLVNRLQEFCLTELDKHYEKLCVKMARKMHKSNSQMITSETVDLFASAIVRTIGHVNFDRQFNEATLQNEGYIRLFQCK